MAEARDGGKPKDGRPKNVRLARGFTRAGGLIQPQLRTAEAKRGFAQARLRALWAEIAGPEIAAMARPQKLTLSRGPSGGLLTLAVSGAHAPQLQMLLPIVRERVNAALGPNAVGRIQLVHAAGEVFETGNPKRRHPSPAADLGALESELSRIGDPGLRAALETLARNVLSRSRPADEPEP